MAKSNIQRLIQLADEVFDVKDDPEQLNVNQEVIDRLHKIHPSTISEFNDGNGPVVWLLVLPTTIDLMHQFLEKSITETELFERTPLNADYEALYLCSALALEEYRRKGITKKLLLDAIEAINKDHPLKYLFVWPFSKEGNALTEKISQLTSMPLFKRSE